MQEFKLSQKKMLNVKGWHYCHLARETTTNLDLNMLLLTAPIYLLP